MTHEEYLESCREKIVSTAKAILSGELGTIAGSRELWRLSYEIGQDKDEDFITFIAIDSETDHLPVDAERENWDKEALKRQDIEIGEYEAFYRDRAFEACKRIIARFDKECRA